MISLNVLPIPSVGSWLMILKQVKKMHGIDFVRGDLLPRNTRNVLFRQPADGFVIDFDLSRNEGHSYVSGFNHKDFLHDDARGHGHGEGI